MKKLEVEIEIVLFLLHFLHHHLIVYLDPHTHMYTTLSQVSSNMLLL